MKPGRLQFSFGVSIFCHAVGIGIITIAGVASHKPALPRQETLLTLMLIAAPEETMIKPVPPNVPAVAPAPIPLPPPKPEATSEISIPLEPTNQVPNTEPTSVPQKMPLNSSASLARGDGSSPQAGLDSTTQMAQVAVRAAPNYLKNPEPPYPATARRRRQEGLVLLSVKVTALGRATSVEVKQSSGFPLLDEAAHQAVRSWEFQPARIGSLAIDSEIEVPVRFKLTE